MRTDAQVTEAANRTADITLTLVATLHLLDRARAIAIELEAENHALTEAAHHLISNYIGDLCTDPTACDCSLARLTRLVNRSP